MARKEHPRKGKRGINLRERVWSYMDAHPHASNKEIADALLADVGKVANYASRYIGGKSIEARLRRMELRVKSLEALVETLTSIKQLSENKAISPSRFIQTV